MSHSPLQSPSSHSPLRDDNEGASSSGMKGNCRHPQIEIFLDAMSRYEFWLNVGLLIQLIKNKQIKNTQIFSMSLGI